jgi:hypothetical protein
MNKKGAWFNVIKSERVVDCINAADIGIAFQVAMDRWERFLGRDDTLAVVPVPPKSTKLVQPATRSEVARYAGWPYDNPQSFIYWTRTNIATQEK